MDYVNKFTGGGGEQKAEGGSSQQQQGGEQQQEGGGGFLGGIGNKLNSAAGGGKESEKNEDMLDKGIDFVQEKFMGGGKQDNESAVEQAKDEQISDFLRGQYKSTTGSDVPIKDKETRTAERMSSPTDVPAEERPIPITIVTGFLGSGKTTLILSLLPQFPPSYRLALLKNEFGDVAVDSQLAAASAVGGVREMLGGCVCCNLVGQLGDALEELRAGVAPPGDRGGAQRPDRIVIETSGSAFPATLALEVRRLARATGRFALDGVLSVLDAENWAGYADTSLTARMQARYTDLVAVNKWEAVGERRLEEVLDRVADLEVEPPVPVVRTDRGRLDVGLVCGLDARLEGLRAGEEEAWLRADGGGGGHAHAHGHGGGGGGGGGGHASEVEVLSITLSGGEAGDGERQGVDLDVLGALLRDATRDEVYRIKGVVYARDVPASSEDAPDTTTLYSSATAHEPPSSSPSDSSVPARYILNWAFGRWTFTPVPLPPPAHPPSDAAAASSAAREPAARLTLVAARGEAARWKRRLEGERFVALEGGGGAAGALSVERVA